MEYILEDSYDLDKPHFNSLSYMSKMLSECNLSQLLYKEANLHGEIKKLKNAQQTLVYDNYNKFVNELETIKVIKNNVKLMEKEMEKLSEKMAEITRMSLPTIDALQRNKQKVLQNSKKSLFLEKFKPLLKLAPTLQFYIDKQMYDEAIHTYVRAFTLLEKYKDIELFQSIKEESNMIIYGLSNELKDTFKTSESVKKSTECIKLLIYLGYSECDLRHLYLNHKEKDLELKISSLQIDPHCDPPSLALFLKKCCMYINELIWWIKIYIALFGNHRKEENDTGVTGDMENFVFSSVRKLSGCVYRRMIAYEKEDSIELATTLDAFYNDIERLDKLLFNVNLNENVLRIIYRIFRKRCQYHFQHLKQDFNQILSNLHGILNHLCKTQDLIRYTRDILDINFSAQALNIKTEIENSLKVFTSNVISYIQPTFGFAKNIQYKGKFVNLMIFSDVVVPFMEYVQSVIMATRVKWRGKLLLIFSKIFCDFANSSTIGIDFGLDALMDLLSAKLSKLEDVLQHIAQNLIDTYVWEASQEVSKLIRISFDAKKWCMATEPKLVKNGMKTAVEEFKFLQIVVSQLYGPSWNNELYSKNKNTFIHLIVDTSKYVGLSKGIKTKDISNLFAESRNLFPSSEFNRPSIVNTIAKLFFKTIEECVRLQTFNSFGLQQVQVDLHFLASQLHFILDKEDFVISRCEDILNDCVVRCLSPISLNPSVIEYICFGKSFAM